MIFTEKRQAITTDDEWQDVSGGIYKHHRRAGGNDDLTHLIQPGGLEKSSLHPASRHRSSVALNAERSSYVYFCPLSPLFQVIHDQPLSMSKRRQMTAAFMQVHMHARTCVIYLNLIDFKELFLLGGRFGLLQMLT